MKTLSMCQPWASLLAEGVKPIELRGWATRYRGQILIRASRNVLPWCDDTDTKVKLPTGCLLFVAELVDVRPMQPADRIGAMGIYWNEDYSWLIRFSYYVRPVPAAGKLRLYDTPDSSIVRLPEAEVRQYHPELKHRTRHTFKASVVHGELMVVDSRTGKQIYYTTHLSHTPPLAWVIVPMYAHIGGLRGGDTPITWQEVAAVINNGHCYLRIEDLPHR